MIFENDLSKLSAPEAVALIRDDAERAVRMGRRDGGLAAEAFENPWVALTELARRIEKLEEQV